MSPGRLHLLYIDTEPDDQALLGLAIDRTDTDIWLYNAPDATFAIQYLLGLDRFGDRNLHPVPGLILLQWRRKGHNTSDFLHWFRPSRFRHIPLAAYSSDPSEEPHALANGASAFFLKPTLFRDLQQTVYQIWQFAQNYANRSGAPLTRHP